VTEEHHYCGTIHAPLGLTTVAKSLEGCTWPVEKRRSGYDGTFFLSSRNDRIDLEMDSGQGPRYLFSGGVDGPEDLARKLLGEFSRLLSAGGVVHRIELYRADAGDMIAYWHYNWPEGQADPGASALPKDR